MASPSEDQPKKESGQSSDTSRNHPLGHGLLPATGYSPVIGVDTFSVSKFNTSDPDFVANWDANVTVENPNNRLKIYFHKIQSWVAYKDYILSSSLNVESLLLDPERHAVLHVKLSTNNSYEYDDQHVLAKKWLEMDQLDRNGGSVSYDLSMMVGSTFKCGWWWTRRSNLKVSCDDLEVRYVGETTNNRILPPGQSRVCTVYA
ncbi:hypothetical protein SLA2020_274450 [Shorea laevis]